MADMALGIGVGVLTFALGYIGMLLQKLLPEAHMNSGSRDMIGAVMGLIALLLALVLGTLVGSAYGFFAVQKANIETLSARAIQLDMTLAQFGPEATNFRKGLKAAVDSAYKEIWIDNVDPRTYSIVELVPALHQLSKAVGALNPKTSEQTSLMPSIALNASVIVQTRLLMSLQLASPISWPLLTIVVSWAMLLFCGYGVMSRLNSTSIIALVVGSFAVGSAIFLILELNQPFTGMFRLPASAMEQAISVLGIDQRPIP